MKGFSKSLCVHFLLVYQPASTSASQVEMAGFKQHALLLIICGSSSSSSIQPHPPPPPWHAHKYTHPYNVWMHLHNNEFSLYHVCNHLDSGRPNSCLIAHGLQSSRGCCLVLTAPEKQREGTCEQESTPEERRRKNLKTHQDSPLILEHKSRVQWEGWRQGKGKSENGEGGEETEFYLVRGAHHRTRNKRLGCPVQLGRPAFNHI